MRDEQTVKIELLSQSMLEAEFRKNIVIVIIVIVIFIAIVINNNNKKDNNNNKAWMLMEKPQPWPGARAVAPDLHPEHPPCCWNIINSDIVKLSKILEYYCMIG